MKLILPQNRHAAMATTISAIYFLSMFGSIGAVIFLHFHSGTTLIWENVWIGPAVVLIVLVFSFIIERSANKEQNEKRNIS